MLQPILFKIDLSQQIVLPPRQYAVVMGDVDLEQQEPFPVEQQDEKQDLPDGRRKLGCCEKFQQSISRWMLPEDARSTYLQRANCCPPPVFIIAISVVEVRDPEG